MQRKPRQHLASHLDFIRSLPCCVCGNNIETEAAHIRMSDGSIAKPMTGNSTKPDDYYTVPLCSAHHRAQHAHGNERDWWKLMEIDPVKTALALYVATGDFERGEQIARRGAG